MGDFNGGHNSYPDIREVRMRKLLITVIAVLALVLAVPAVLSPEARTLRGSIR
jgi:hypothetical protein